MKIKGINFKTVFWTILAVGVLAAVSYVWIKKLHDVHSGLTDDTEMTNTYSCSTMEENAYMHSNQTDDAEKANAYSDLTMEQLENHLKECDIALERLKKIIESEESNPEERFDARRAYNSISRDRKKIREQLKAGRVSETKDSSSEK